MNNNLSDTGIFNTGKSHLLMVAILSLTLLGCKREPNAFSDDFVVRFSVGSSVDIEIDSKTIPKTKTAKPLIGGTTVRIVAYKSKSETPSIGVDKYITSAAYVVEGDGGVLFPCNVDAEGNFVDKTDAPSIRLFKGDYDFYAYSPARALNVDHKTVSNIPHGEDFLGIMPVTHSISKSTSDVELSAFDHKCSRVIFDVSPSAGVEFDELRASKIVMSNLATSPVGYTLADVITPSTGTSDFSIIDFTHASAGKGSTGEGVVLPKGLSKIKIVFELKINGADYELEASDLDGVTFVQGLRYEFEIHVASRSVELYLRIVSWDGVDWNDPNMGGGNGSVLVGIWTDIDWNDSNMGGGNGGVLLGTWKGVDWSDDNMGGE